MMPPPGVPLPPGIVPPPAAPVVAPAADPAAAAPSEPAPAKESTTVYVGKIPPSVDDALVRKLLDACGEVRSWKRVMDPENNTPKRFGFCEFADAEGVLRAMRILDGFPVANEELLLNVNQATKAYVEGYAEKRTATAEEDASVDAERRAVLESAVAAAGHAAEAEAFLAGALRPTNVSAAQSAAATPPDPPDPPNPPNPLGGAFGAPTFVAARDPDSIAPPPPDGGAGIEALSLPELQSAKNRARRSSARRGEREREERARLDREHRERERRSNASRRPREGRQKGERARDVERDSRDDDDGRRVRGAAGGRSQTRGDVADAGADAGGVGGVGPPAWVRDERGRERRRVPRTGEGGRRGIARRRRRRGFERQGGKRSGRRERRRSGRRESGGGGGEGGGEAARAAEGEGGGGGNREASLLPPPAPLFAKKPAKKTAAVAQPPVLPWRTRAGAQEGFVPIEYTAEELAAAAAPASTMAGRRGRSPAAGWAAKRATASSLRRTRRKRRRRP